MIISRLEKYERLFDVPPKKKDWLNLDRIKKLLKILGNPQEKLKSKGVHVAGTNGKGSTCAMTQSILTQAGYKVGMFTSPHLYNMTERFRIDYKDISEIKLAKYFIKIKPYVKKVKKEIGDSPTWFEVLTCIAILYFIDEKVDAAIFEVGLGGRLDATNVLDSGICVITDISIDHKEYLGNTIAKIAKEKAGIVKNDSVVLTSNRGAALRVIEKVCKKKKCKICKISKICKKYKLNLLGEHQRRNAGLVLEIIKELKRKGFKIKEQAIKKGLRSTKWPARFELQVTNYKLLVTTIIDSAHNPGGFKTLVRTFKQQGFKRAIVLFSCKKTKDVRANLRILKPIVKEIIFPKIPDLDFMYKPSTLKKIYSKGIIKNDIKLAIKKAKVLAQDYKLPILICGSMYAIQYYRKYTR